jgi:hypothetical protein
VIFLDHLFKSESGPSGMLIPGRYCSARVTTDGLRFVATLLLVTFAQKAHRQLSPSHEEDVRARAAKEVGFIVV